MKDVECSLFQMGMQIGGGAGERLLGDEWGFGGEAWREEERYYKRLF